MIIIKANKSLSFAKDEKAESVLKVISGLAIGLVITILILGNILAATDTSISGLNDTDASSGYENVKSYIWVGIPLLGVLIIVIVGRQLMDNT